MASEDVSSVSCSMPAGSVKGRSGAGTSGFRGSPSKKPWSGYVGFATAEGELTEGGGGVCDEGSGWVISQCVPKASRRKLMKSSINWSASSRWGCPQAVRWGYGKADCAWQTKILGKVDFGLWGSFFRPSLRLCCLSVWKMIPVGNER